MTQLNRSLYLGVPTQFRKLVNEALRYRDRKNRPSVSDLVWPDLFSSGLHKDSEQRSASHQLPVGHGGHSAGSLINSGHRPLRSEEDILK
ncbi:hypothetical protein RRG08_063843 [Elysia crispata]|uniref:Uncharacterized protein n=1 Tax=Elysia crispata TaxID=231223 RepID=A0AAE0Y6U1_9GAST|nr:hypothetical protein RRG08_063843 [Elysia crispata]